MADQPRHFPNSDALCEHIASISGDTALVSFSCGKDAVASWFQCKRYFKRLVPFYMYIVPELEFVEAGIRYFEEKLQTPILRLPHPSLPRMLREYVFQPPERCQDIESARFPKLTHEQVNDHVRRIAGAPDAYVALGTRAADSLVRRANVIRWGTADYRKRLFLPVYDWKLDDVVACIEREQIRLPVDYRLFGRSFDGLDYRFLEPIRREFPADYWRIVEWFPLADLEFKRREFAAERSV